MTYIVYKLKEKVGDWEKNSSIRYVIEYSTLQGFLCPLTAFLLHQPLPFSKDYCWMFAITPLLSLKISINCMEKHCILLKIKMSKYKAKESI